MIINPSSGIGRQSKNSISLVFLLIFVLKSFTLDGNRNLWPGSGYSLMMLTMMMIMMIVNSNI